MQSSMSSHVRVRFLFCELSAQIPGFAVGRCRYLYKGGKVVRYVAISVFFVFILVASGG